MTQPLEDRVEAVLHWVRLLPVTPMRDRTIDLIQELLATTYRLERERDDALDMAVDPIKTYVSKWQR